MGYQKQLQWCIMAAMAKRNVSCTRISARTGQIASFWPQFVNAAGKRSPAFWSPLPRSPGPSAPVAPNYTASPCSEPDRFPRGLGRQIARLGPQPNRHFALRPHFAPDGSQGRLSGTQTWKHFGGAAIKNAWIFEVRGQIAEDGNERQCPDEKTQAAGDDYRTMLHSGFLRTHGSSDAQRLAILLRCPPVHKRVALRLALRRQQQSLVRKPRSKDAQSN